MEGNITNITDSLLHKMSDSLEENMTRKLITFITESLYGTFVCFFYYYLAATFVGFKPFALGFHPPMDFDKLSSVLIIIYACVAAFKAFTFIFDYMNSEQKPTQRISYIPSRRY
jgi:hypothetical protein